MRHRKRYKNIGTGVELLCGNKVIAFDDYTYLANWQVCPCPECGMDVQTIGSSPETDKVQEIVLNR